MSPKVFVSHASEDKDRSVIKFAESLRGKGIDAWLDKWEMLPGDSLIDKIFEEGLKEAQAVIIVLSKYSIEKPWVKEELNTSVVNKIDKGTRLIPVVLDDCEVPESLKSTLWESIKDLESYQESFDRIVASIFGQRDKPPIGQPPSYVGSNVVDIPELTKTDNFVLKKSCELVLQHGDRLLNPGKVFFENDQIILPESELKESLEILDHHGFIEIHRTFGGWGPYKITLHGFNEYLKAYVDDFDQIIEDIVVALVNKGVKDNASLQSSLNKPIAIINHVLDLLENSGHIKCAKVLGGGYMVHHMAPTLRRMLS